MKGQDENQQAGETALQADAEPNSCSQERERGDQVTPYDRSRHHSSFV
jgi:hypothetical protein